MNLDILKDKQAARAAKKKIETIWKKENNLNQQQKISHHVQQKNERMKLRSSDKNEKMKFVNRTRQLWIKPRFKPITKYQIEEYNRE